MQAAADLARALALALDPVAVFEAGVGSPDAWQADVLSSQAPRMLLNCSRQSGKSTTVAALAIHEAVYRPPALVLMLSRAQDQSSELYRKARLVFNALGRPVPVVGESARRLELANGSRIVSLPGTEATVRSYSGVRLLLIDEASRVPDDLYYAVRPMIAVSGGRLVALSTPFGRRGWWWEAWEKGGDEWARVCVPAELCARIPPDFLEAEKRAMPGWRFRQEYGCSFEAAVDQVFADEFINRAFDASVRPIFDPEAMPWNT